MGDDRPLLQLRARQWLLRGKTTAAGALVDVRDYRRAAAQTLLQQRTYKNNAHRLRGRRAGKPPLIVRRGSTGIKLLFR